MSAAVSTCEPWDAGVGLSKGAVAGHIKQAAALNARRVSTRSTLHLCMEKPVNGPVHTPLLKPPSLPEKVVFFPLQDQIRGLHGQETLTEVVLARAFSAVPCCFWRSVL